MSREVPLFDATRISPALRERLHAAAARVLDGGVYIQGPEVARFEAAAASALGVAHAVAVSSGSDALLVALWALGVGPGDEVLCPAFTFVAPVEAVVRLGATPVLVDVDPACFTLDPASALAAAGPRTKAVLPVHLFGQSAELAALRPLRERGVAVVEDAAQAFGVPDADGKMLGSLGECGCFSFFPTKLLGGYGDGGLVTTNDAALAAEVRLLAAHGARPKYHHVALGGNFRLDALHAALLGEKLPHVPAWLAERRALAARYDRAFAPLAPRLVVPPAPRPHGYHQYVLRFVGEGARDAAERSLRAAGIGCQVYYPEPLHHAPAYARFARGPLPEAERACREVLAIPLFPGLHDAEVEAVIDAVTAATRGCS